MKAIERRKDFEDRSYWVFKRWEYGMTLFGVVVAIGGGFLLDGATDSVNSIAGTDFESIGLNFDLHDPAFWILLLVSGGAGGVAGNRVGRAIAKKIMWWMTSNRFKHQ